MTAFHATINAHPVPFEPAASQMFFDELVEKSGQEAGLAPLARLLAEEPPVCDLVRSVMSLSPYLRTLMRRQPEMLQASLMAPVEGHLDALCEGLGRDLRAAGDAPAAMRLLRRFKQHAALAIALYDSCGALPVERIVAKITRVADSAVAEALGFLFRRARDAGKVVSSDPDPAAASGYFVLAMGKHGGFELNYSSDIDLIIFFDKDRLNLAAGVEPQPFFVRLTRDLVQLLNERTADGYVFRTDLRLRPDPGATQVAMSTEAALVYYESYGQNWERAAMIKARTIAGDIAAGERFLEELAPYIWRKYLDFATINDIHAMKRQIHAFKGHGTIAVAGHNIKLGRGGIREIEFFVQTQQLIAGGRQTALRHRQTLVALERLHERNWIGRRAAEELANAYKFLRHVEHRLQMVDDQQTQTLPSDPRELLRIANFAGFATLEEFSKMLVTQLEKVQAHYAALFEQVPELTTTKTGGDLVFTGDTHDPGTLESLAAMGFHNPGAVVTIVQDWHRARYPAMRSARAREALTELTPLLIGELAGTSNPDAAFNAFDEFLKRLPAGVQLFSLLRSNPQLLHLMADIMGTAPRLANVLSHRAKLLDAVLDPAFFGPLPRRAELDGAFNEGLQGARDQADKLDRARIVGREQAFLVGVRVLTGTITPEQAGEAYATLAASAIAHMHRVAREEIEALHGGFSSGGSCVLAMGKLGGSEMTASSDLDLIVIYDHPAVELQSDGKRPLPASQYYNRLTQRLVTGLSAPTGEGRLYEVDMRLRPSGNAGPVATSLQGFRAYQTSDAWTWEHMALTRARIVSGPPGLAAHIDAVRREILAAPRDPAKVAKDVAEMRELIFKEKGSEDVWSLKQVRGGLVDLEFIAQYLQLVHAAEAPEVLEQNTASALRKLAIAGKLDWNDAELLIDGAWLLHSLTQVLRLCYEHDFDARTAPEGLKALLARAIDSPDFSHVEARLAETEQAIARLYRKYVAEPAAVAASA
jgi:glutamate-ammonia-ligase adenylyltransferase